MGPSEGDMSPSLRRGRGKTRKKSRKRGHSVSRLARKNSTIWESAVTPEGTPPDTEEEEETHKILAEMNRASTSSNLDSTEVASKDLDGLKIDSSEKRKEVSKVAAKKAAKVSKGEGSGLMGSIIAGALVGETEGGLQGAAVTGGASIVAAASLGGTMGAISYEVRKHGRKHKHNDQDASHDDSSRTDTGQGTEQERMHGLRKHHSHAREGVDKESMKDPVIEVAESRVRRKRGRRHKHKSKGGVEE
jgi:hypothetical protein